MTDMLTHLNNVLQKLPKPQRQEACEAAITQLLAQFCTHINLGTIHILTTFPHTYETLLAVQCNYSFVLQMITYIGPDYFSPDIKYHFHQLFLNYTLKCCLLNSPQEIDQGAEALLKVFAEHHTYVTPYSLNKDYEFLQREAAASLLQLGGLARSSIHKNAFFNFSICAIEIIPPENRTDADQANIILAKKLVQFTDAKELFLKKISTDDTDVMHEHIVETISAMEDLTHADIAQHNLFWIDALESKRVDMIDFYFKKLEKYIYALERNLLKRPYFFSGQQGKEVKDLFDLYQQWIKPLLHNKSETRCAKATWFIRAYMENKDYPKHAKRLLSPITKYLESITIFEAEETHNPIEFRPRRFSC